MQELDAHFDERLLHALLERAYQDGGSLKMSTGELSWVAFRFIRAALIAGQIAPTISNRLDYPYLQVPYRGIWVTFLA